MCTRLKIVVRVQPLNPFEETRHVLLVSQPTRFRNGKSIAVSLAYRTYQARIRPAQLRGKSGLQYVVLSVVGIIVGCSAKTKRYAQWQQRFFTLKQQV